MTGRTWSGSRPLRMSVRQAMRRHTPSAASSGPCPATSPMSRCSVPSSTSHDVEEVAAEDGLVAGPVAA